MYVLEDKKKREERKKERMMGEGRRERERTYMYHYTPLAHTHTLQVKLSDFGMARVLDENSEVYNLSNLGARIPIAW